MIGPKTIPPQSWVLCEKGHRVCFCEGGIPLGTSLNDWMNRFSRWQQPEPKMGTRILDLNCEECGAPYWQFNKFEPA